MKLILTIIATLIALNLSFAQTSSSELTHLGFMAQSENYIVKQPRVRMDVGRLELIGETKIFIPKSFSPNADGVNDVFKIHSLNVDAFEMSIFDQWGEFLFSTNDVSLEWDGTLYNQEVRKGAYVYVIKLKTMNGQSKKYSGCLMIKH
jgi:gliding motility-associated-like protein